MKSIIIISLVEEGRTEARTAGVLSRVDSDSLGGKVVEGEGPVAIGSPGHCDLGAAIVAIVIAAIHAIGQVKLTDRSSCSKAQINRVDLSGLAELQTSEAHIL